MPSSNGDASTTQGNGGANGDTSRLTPVAVLLLVVGVLFADEDGALGVVGLVALAQGVGLAVAVVSPALGHNPLSRRYLSDTDGTD